LFINDRERWIHTKKLYGSYVHIKENNITQSFLDGVNIDYTERLNILNKIQRQCIEKNSLIMYFFNTVILYLVPIIAYLYFINEFILDYHSTYQFLLLIAVCFSLQFIFILKKHDKISRKNIFLLMFSYTYYSTFYIILIIGLLFIILFAYLIYSGEVLLFTISSNIDMSWHLTIAGASFSLSIALFIVISLTSLIKHQRIVQKNIIDDFSKLHFGFFSSIDTPSPPNDMVISDFYDIHGEEIGVILEKYRNSAIVTKSFNRLTYSIMIFMFFGLVFLSVPFLPPSEGGANTSGLLSDKMLFASFAGLVLYTGVEFIKLTKYIMNANLEISEEVES
jgi:hypothetical protein